MSEHYPYDRVANAVTEKIHRLRQEGKWPLLLPDEATPKKAMEATLFLDGIVEQTCQELGVELPGQSHQKWR
jgi:hypothetical protein